jgi:hypothetical protein
MFRNQNQAHICNQSSFDPLVDKMYGNENLQEHGVKRFIPWLVALAITAAALIALAEGYFA